jgi:DNA-binding CsgD family transcriptional regulator
MLHVTKRRNGELFACKIITYYQQIKEEKFMISHVKEEQTDIPLEIICLQQNILVLKRELEKERNLNRYNQLKEQCQQLLLNYPSLSHKDLQLCKYILQNWSAQEIADELNITVNGVFAARKRLRKKMELDPGNDLLNALIDAIQ